MQWYGSVQAGLQTEMTFDAHHILSPDGPVARRLGTRYEQRPEQGRMIDAVSHALAQGGKLVVEAGTGVGKSFAYLLPAIERVVTSREEADEGRATRGRVVRGGQSVAATPRAPPRRWSGWRSHHPRPRIQQA